MRDKKSEYTESYAYTNINIIQSIRQKYDFL